MNSIQTVQLDLWEQDAIVLFDWLSTTDLNTVPSGHKAVKQALADLFNQLEQSKVSASTPSEVEAAKEEVSRDMGW